MPWYRTGTVSVTLNSNAVIGTGTAFVANSRVGDAFLGPDGGWYEVTNIASDSAMSIAPNYRGATNAAGVYALTPVQGYTKDLADQARAMIQQWGSTLAGLGSVATENIVPVSKGGTGGTTQAAARTSLGLGAAATRGVGVANGNLMELWASPVVTGNSSFALDGSRFISYLDGTTTASPPGAPNAAGIRSRFADNSLWAIDIVAGVYQTAAGLYWRQVNASGTPLGWRLIYDNANTTRAADGTLKAI